MSAPLRPPRPPPPLWPRSLAHAHTPRPPRPQLGCTLWLMHRMAPYHRALFLTALHTADAAAIFGPTDIREVCGDDATCHDEATPAEPPH
eukprot:6618853-Prymnesium_polylepis.2